MKSTEFTGTTAQMKTSPWLASEDLLGLPSPEMEIASVVRNNDVPMDGGRKEKELFSIAFKGASKQLILNATNRRTLSQAYGASTKNWIGKRVAIYVQEDVKMAGKTVSGLRLRSISPSVTAPFTPPQPKPEPAESEPGGFALSDAPETNVERLSRMINEDGLDLDKVDRWLNKKDYPELAMILEHEAGEIIPNFVQIKKEAV